MSDLAGGPDRLEEVWPYCYRKSLRFRRSSEFPAGVADEPCIMRHSKTFSSALVAARTVGTFVGTMCQKRTKCIVTKEYFTTQKIIVCSNL